MSNIIVDGFGHYGNNAANSVTAQQSAMLAGSYAQIGNFGGIGPLPWDVADTDPYAAVAPSDGPGLRRVLPAAVSTATFFSFYFGMPNLPSSNSGNVIQFNDNSNTEIAYINVDTTGVLELHDANGTLIASTSGPVLVAETAYHIELSFTPGGSGTGACTLKVAEQAVITATGITWSNTNNLAQWQMGTGGGIGGVGTTFYYGHLIVRNTSGTYNTGFIGDRKVATLLVTANGTDQGWTSQTLQKFGNGILANGVGIYPGASVSANAGVYMGSSTKTDMSNLDFTIEGFFKFQSLPTGSNKATFFGKWDQSSNNKRSYQLYLGGPSLGGGNLAWQISTDGTSGTASVLWNAPWPNGGPVPGVWYHIAVCRASTAFRVFINGVEVGTSITDSNTYYTGTAPTVLGCQLDGNSGDGGTGFVGWVDEFRMTQGYAQYTANFTAPTTAFPRGGGSDTQWSDRVWLSGWETGVFDDSGYSETLTAINGAIQALPADGTAAWQTIAKAVPGTPYASMDDNFIEAPLISASNIFTQTGNFSNGDTITIATQDGTTAAVYTAQTSLTNSYGHFLIGASLAASLANLVAAINAGAGSGTTYAAATTANHDVTGVVITQSVTNQILVTAITPGTAGNSLASTTTASLGSWASTSTLAGGVSIPSDSEFKMQQLPSTAAVADSLTIVRRSWKTNAGTCTTKSYLVGVGGTAVAGQTVAESTTPTLYGDLYEADPDNSGNPISVPAVNACQVKINRTA